MAFATTNLHFVKRNFCSHVASNKPKRIFITGGQGFLGSYVTKKLLQLQSSGEVEAIVSFDLQKDTSIWDQVLTVPEAKSFREIQDFEYLSTQKGNWRVLGDVSNFDDVCNSIKGFNPSHVIHLGFSNNLFNMQLHYKFLHAEMIQ